MKKYIFFQKVLLCLLTIVPYLNYGQTVITYPAANAVFQATDVNPDVNVVDNKATVYFAGQSDEATTGSFGNLFYKLEKKDNQGNWSIYANKKDIAITSNTLSSSRKGFFSMSMTFQRLGIGLLFIENGVSCFSLFDAIETQKNLVWVMYIL